MEPSIDSESDKRQRMMSLDDTELSLASLSLERAASLPPSRADVTRLDEHGDLQLKIGPDKKVFVVDSRTVLRSSAVWASILHKRVAMPDPDSTTSVTVELPDDDPWALGLLLAIIHGDFSRPPASPKLEELFRLTIATHKYDMAHVLRPWAAKWCDKLDHKQMSSFEAEDALSYLRSLWIAWELGDSSIFNSAARALLKLAEVDGDDNLVDEAGVRFDDMLNEVHFSSVDILEAIAETRIDIIEAVLDPVDKTLQALLEGTYQCLTLPRDVQAKDELAAQIESDCTTMVLGSLIKALVKEDLFPIPSSSDIFESVSQLQSRLRRALSAVQTLRPHTTVDLHADREFHMSCNPGPHLIETIDEICRTKISALLGSSAHQEHIRAQAAKTGRYDI